MNAQRQRDRVRDQYKTCLFPVCQKTSRPFQVPIENSFDSS